MCDYTRKPAKENMLLKHTVCISYNYIFRDIKLFCKPLFVLVYDVDNTFQHDVNLTFLIWDCM